MTKDFLAVAIFVVNMADATTTVFERDARARWVMPSVGPEPESESDFQEDGTFEDRDAGPVRYQLRYYRIDAPMMGGKMFCTFSFKDQEQTASQGLARMVAKQLVDAQAVRSMLIRDLFRRVYKSVALTPLIPYLVDQFRAVQQYLDG